MGKFGRMYGLLSNEVCFFRVLRHTADSWSCACSDYVLPCLLILLAFQVENFFCTVIVHNAEQQCDFGSTLPREESHIIPGGLFTRLWKPLS